MRKLFLALLLAASISSCTGVTIGPVDHSCRSNPGYSQGSGCAHGHG